MKNLILAITMIFTINCFASVGDGTSGVTSVGDGTSGVTSVGDGTSGVTSVGDGTSGVTSVGDGSSGATSIGNRQSMRLGNGFIRNCLQNSTVCMISKR